MLAALLTFRGRICRIKFLLSCLALGPALVFAFVFLMFIFGFHAADKSTYLKSIGLAALVVLPVNFWTSLSLQSCRIRDIGWNPVAVILGWMGFNFVFQLFVTASAAASAHGLPPHPATGAMMLLGLFNFAMIGVLFCWPGARADDDAASPGAAWSVTPNVPSAPRPIPTARLSPSPGGFGRRGL